MDIQKERKAFEKHASKFFKTNEAFEDDGENYVYDEVKFMWDCWLAAKAQAVPEGFVLVSKEPTDAMLFAASGRDIVAEHYGDENILWPELRETWKAMITAAQEPAND